MLKKRVIFTLLYDNASFMLSRNFRLQKVGDIQWLNKNYDFSHITFSIDELIILDVTRGTRNEGLFQDHVKSLTRECFVPIAAGGGIRTLDQAQRLLRSGADKLVLNSTMHEDINLVKELVKIYGSQSIVASIDYKVVDSIKKIFINNGTEELDVGFSEYLQYVDSLNIGEIYLNSIDMDGTGFGYDLDTIKTINNLFVPIIVAGGAGNGEHFEDVLKLDNVSAVATANLFNFIGDGLLKARKKLIEKKFNLAVW